MASAGRWLKQNKEEPGIYINFESPAGYMSKPGERGVVTIAKQLSGCPKGEVVIMEDPRDVKGLLG